MTDSSGRPTFEQLLEEAATVDVTGSDFSWLAGRATEERPPWGYSRLAGERSARARRVLDAHTGDGRVLAGALTSPPEVLAVTDSRPNLLRQAHRNLAAYDVLAVQADAGKLPFAAGAFDLVLSRHPGIRATRWPEIVRVLAPGGRYLSQQVGLGSGAELVEALLGPREIPDSLAEREAAAAEAAGLRVIDLRKAILHVTFTDIGAVVYILRKTAWFVPDFTVEPYRERLRLLDKHIRSEGAFDTYVHRFLIEAVHPS